MKNMNKSVGAPTAEHTDNFYRLAMEKGRCSDAYYREIGHWLRNGLDKNSHNLCRSLANDYLSALNSVLSDLEARKNLNGSGDVVRQMIRDTKEFKSLLQIDILKFGLD